jgi:hypothetical protein
MVIPPSEWIFKVLDFKQQNGWLLFLLIIEMLVSQGILAFDCEKTGVGMIFGTKIL